MIKNLLSFFVCIIVSLGSLAQSNYPFLQPGTTQGVRHFITPSSTPENWSFTHKDDSTWCGYEYSRICYIQSGYSTSCDVPGSGYTRGIREENGIAYIRGTSCGGETIQYDFNLAVGDTFDMVGLLGDAIVDSVSTKLMLNGQTRKYIKLRSIDEPGVYFRWVEGIGDIDRGFFRSVNLDGGYSELICHSDSSGLVYLKPNYTVNCDSLLLLSSINERTSFASNLLFPNPAASTVYLNASFSLNSEFTLFDITGKTLLRVSIIDGHSIDVTSIPNGIYFYQIINQNKSFNGKLIVSH